MTLLSRRTILAGVVSIPLVGCADGADESSADILRAYFDGKLDEAATIGNAYLASNGPPLDAAPLAGMIGRASDAPSTLEELDRRVDADFEEGDVLVVSGWLASRTEVLLCVLAARRLT